MVPIRLFLIGTNYLNVSKYSDKSLEKANTKRIAGAEHEYRGI